MNNDITIQKFVANDDPAKIFYKLTIGNESRDMTPMDVLRFVRKLTEILYQEKQTLDVNPTAKN